MAFLERSSHQPTRPSAVDLAALTAKLDAVATAPPGDASVTACDAVLAALEGAEMTSAAQALTARALFTKARLLSRLGRTRASEMLVAELVRRYEHDPEPAVRRLVCRALFGTAKAKLAEGTADRRAVIVDYRHILHIAERAPTLDVVAVEALYHLALTHAKIAVQRSNDEHREKALERFVEVERRFSGSSAPEIACWVTRGATSRALLFSLEDAGPLYEAVVTRYAAETDPTLRVYAADALALWAERSLGEGQHALAASLADRLLATFAESEGEHVRAHRATAERVRARVSTEP
ncbi:MAG: hypothetical protein KF819_20565 [Labilithrix sp.]|nr:hypothetical protein [Labilithrix sp.]